ncbi:MAG: sigma-E factor negative regulatory protein [Xanthomonadales bacterium]|nr:sigma-E factor negative regulatory protein [Xanthomonadales bacterium]
MNKETLEHISSLMDGEINRETGMFLTRRLSSDAALSQTWRRYHIIRDCIRQPGARASALDFAGLVRHALAEEAAIAASSARQRRWLKPVAGLAVAATVCFMAILAVGPVQQPVNDPATDTAQPFTSPNPISATPVTQAASFNLDDQARAARMNAYLLRHNQLAGSVGRQGFVSFVPIISSTARDGQAIPDAEATESVEQEELRTTP